MVWKIPLSDIDFTAEESDAVLRVIESGWLTMGAVTQQFEEEFAAYTGARHAVAVTNATAGLHLSCLTAGVGPGDEVILPSLTFVATANAVRYTGATPVFADIEGEGSLNISPASIEANIGERTRAIMVVHYGGYACDMPAIMEIADRHDLVVIEDAAHAVGSSLEKRMLGTWGRTGCFSFFSNKNMTTGEGGMIVTDDDDLAGRLRRLRSHGMTSLTWDRHQGHAWSYDVVDLGYNYRLDEIRAALGRVQLSKLDSYNSHRRELTVLYREWLQELAPAIEIPFRDHPGISACHLLPVLLPPGVDRRKFMESMKRQGIQTSIHYPPVHRFQAYRANGQQTVSLPATEAVAARELTLPLYPAMSAGDIELVVRSARDSLQGQ
ncbi:MAG: DegT/DnrJ/EryC1/StrS family aminotransferase [Chloroflexi bacterium]|nr:DegT/DnrJ/EryC1/StrS family aminotransferase [Chloroflexota bacterium]